MKKIRQPAPPESTKELNLEGLSSIECPDVIDLTDSRFLIDISDPQRKVREITESKKTRCIDVSDPQ